MSEAIVAAARRWFLSRKFALEAPTMDVRLDDRAAKVWSNLADAEDALSRAVFDDLPFDPGSDSAATESCFRCERKFFTKRSLRQHLRDRHGISIAAEAYGDP